MHFAFSVEQRAFQQAFRELCEKACPPEHLRAMASHETGRSPGLWKQMAEMGVVGLTAPEAAGGMGGDEVDLVLLLEETGRAALPEPLAEHTGIGIPLLAELAPDDPRLAEAASGATILTVGLEASAFVADAHVAGLLLLGRDGEIHAVPPEGAQVTAQPSVDRTRRIFTVAWEPSADTLLAGDAGQAAARAFDRGVLAAAAQACGVGLRVVELAAQYAVERQQFGAPIGSFQAVKHLLADALLAVEFARPVVYRAAWSVARDVAERSRDVSMAKAFASEAVVRACRTALQVHGAIGYTEEHDLHLWLKRGWALAAAWGDAARHRARVGEAIG